MRAIPWVMVAALAAGCASNWTGDPFQSAFESTPHWADCDGDGLGDPLWDDRGEGQVNTSQCIDPLNDNAPTCEDGSAGVWVQNDRDCDDTYAESGGGARYGYGCAHQWEPGAGPGDYRVIASDGKEFLIWQGYPRSIGEAHTICNAWREGARPEGSLDSDDEDEVAAIVEFEALLLESPLATLDTDLQQGDVIRALREIAPWRGFVGIRGMSLDDTVYAWDLGLEESDPVVDDIPFCDGGSFTPREALTSYHNSEDGETQESLQEAFGEFRLVLSVDADGDFCLTNQFSDGDDSDNDELCGTEVCVQDIVCERPLLDPPDLFDLGQVEACLGEAASAAE